MPDKNIGGKETHGISDSATGVLLTLALVIGTILIVAFPPNLPHNPPPNPPTYRIPQADIRITNIGTAITIYHEGGSPLYRGQGLSEYSILVDGVDLTDDFIGPDPLTAGTNLSYHYPVKPKRVAMEINTPHDKALVAWTIFDCYPDPEIEVTGKDNLLCGIQ